MEDRSRALRVLGLREGADESEAHAAYRALRLHVEARERSAPDEAAREARRGELRELDALWRAAFGTPESASPPSAAAAARRGRGRRGEPRWLVGWAVAAVVLVVTGFVWLVFVALDRGPAVLVDGAGGGGEGAAGGPGYAIEDPGEDGEAGSGEAAEALDAGPRAALVATSEIEGATLIVRTRDEPPEVVAEGAADDTRYWLAPGEYTVEVRHPDCRDAWQQAVRVQGGETVDLDPELCGDTAWMVVRSNVTGDELHIDGEKKGATGEKKHPVSPGEHEVRVAKSGYRSWEGIVEVEPGQVLGIRPRLEAVQPAERRPRPKRPEPEPARADAGAPTPSDEEAEQQYGRWHEDARRWLLARYDFDRSGALDSREEIEAIPCDSWLGLEQSYDQSGLGLSLTRFYGFDGERWRSGALGVADATRDLAYERMQACGLR